EGRSRSPTPTFEPATTTPPTKQQSANHGGTLCWQKSLCSDWKRQRERPRKRLTARGSSRSHCRLRRRPRIPIVGRPCNVFDLPPAPGFVQKFRTRGHAPAGGGPRPRLQSRPAPRCVSVHSGGSRAQPQYCRELPHSRNDDFPKTRARAPNRRRRPQFLAALVQHLLLGPACFHWSDERVLDLFLYRAQPLLSACRAALKTLNLDFQFPDPIFGSSQLKREPMRHGHRSLDVLVGDVSRFLQQTNHGVPSLINRFKFGSLLFLRSKSHDFTLGLIHLSLLTDA